MPNVTDKPAVKKQRSLPFSRAFKISMNSLRIRFWRSMITAAGILLGIAFLTTVLTQWLMQWPIPQKIGSGHVKIDGEIVGPGEYEVWNAVTVAEAEAAGISPDVIDAVGPVEGKFSLAGIVQGIEEAKNNEKKLDQAKKDLAALKKISKSFYSGDNADKDISVSDAIKEGVPSSIAKRLAGDGTTFKRSAIGDALKEQPDRIEKLERTVVRTSVFNTVDEATINKLAESHKRTLADVIEESRGLEEHADLARVMIVNANDKDRKLKLDLTEEGDVKASDVVLKSGDNIEVPDKNSYYRMIWLVVMSLLVCAVGITNSMLMAVTERFKEIGTMKCLGATDGFVVTLFMLEAGMQGIIASLLGFVVGFVSMILVAGFSKGWSVVASINFVDIVIVFFVSTFIGMILTAIATIIPALRAAAMPAAMALRSEI